MMMMNKAIGMVTPFMALVFSSLYSIALSAPTSAQSANCDPNARAISHGSMVALQLTAAPTEWLSCSVGPECYTSSCPGLYIEGEDWNECEKEVLKIYRALGPGHIQVGDLVGLYAPQKQAGWLGCNSSDCGVSSSCLEPPLQQTGFYNGVPWPECLEHVFEIQAHNKRRYQIVESGDDVSFHLLSSISGYLSHQSGVIQVGECQSQSVSEECAEEIFSVWTRQ